MAREWTSAQRDAIWGDGGSMLVSAAAGSGKTAVLVERAIRLLTDPNKPVEADRLLIVTFTNAAAAEMRQRIGGRLGEMIRAEPDNIALQRQQALLARASIGTVHSFCLELVRQNFQHLPIASDFTLADEGELTILRTDCAREVVESFYDRDESGVFSALVELLASGRDDSRLLETVLRVYEFSRSHPFPLRWLERMQALYTDGAPVAESVWGQAVLAHARDSLRHCVAALEGACELSEGEEAVYKAYGTALQSDLTQAVRLLELVDTGRWDEAVEALREAEFVRLGPLRGNEAVKERLKSVRERCRNLVEELRDKAMNATAAEFREDMADLGPKIAVLFDLVRAFGERFAQRKVEKKRMDFSDLEHFALELLVRPLPDDGTGDGWEPTAQAAELAARYEQVMVDEFQDTNEVQDRIFQSVSRGGDNLFYVGDAKQSIYSFRLATPEIFLDKRERYAPFDGEHFPARVSLDANFRSRAGVVGAVNFLFGLLMSRGMGEIDYAGEERLRCGAAYYPEAPDMEPELLLLSTGDYEGELDAARLEARMVARRIRELLDGGFRVTEGEGTRPVRPGDICILMRSPKNRTELYMQELREAGVSAWAQNAGGFLETREVSMTLSLLEALDNPLLDAPLVAAMLSPLFGFSDDELAAIRLGARGEPFYLAVRAAARAGDERARDFAVLFSELRGRAAVLPADRLLLEVYERTGALSLVRAMPRGEERLGNLQLLVEYAANYHGLGYKGLGGLLGFVRRLRERGGDLAPSGGSGESAGAVRIMSVHRSKGLEFPVVILADTAKLFNRSDLIQNAQLHSRLGFACARRNPHTMAQFATLPMQAIRIESERSMLSEELRVLYVALTRPMEKLIVVAPVRRDLAKKLGALHAELEDGQLPPRMVGEGRAPADWLLMAMLHHPDAGALREAAGLHDLIPFEDGSHWTVRLEAPKGDAPLDPETAPPSRAASPDPEMVARLEARAAWRYEWEALTRTPTKLAISAVAKGAAAAEYRFARRPRFLSEQALTPAERGTAMHKFMQFADYGAARDRLDAEIERLRAGGYLTGAEIDSLDKTKLTAFFTGELAGRIFASETVWRELKFMWECGNDMLGDFLPELPDGAAIALQGVADCVFLEQGGAVIVDYKTDRVQRPDQLVALYEGQMILYRRILEKTLPVPVRGCVLYSFALDRAVVLGDETQERIPAGKK